jgi:hypothetical protein
MLKQRSPRVRNFLSEVAACPRGSRRIALLRASAVLNLCSMTVQLYVDQMAKFLDVRVSSLHCIHPRKLGCVVHKTHDVLVSFATLAVDKDGYVHRNIFSKRLAADSVEFLENSAVNFDLAQMSHTCLLSDQLGASVRMIVLDLCSITVQLHVDQMAKFLDVLVSSCHCIHPRKLGCVVHKTHDELVSFATLAVEKDGYVHRNIFSKRLAANSVKFLENSAWQL